MTMTEFVPGCAVVIPTYNGATLTATCLEALLASPPSTCAWRIVVVDDGSSDGTPEVLARFGSQITVLDQGTNTGFAQACNSGARAGGECEFVVFLNNDTLPTAGWLDALVDEVRADERVAAVGARLLFPNGQVQHAGVTIGQDGWPHHLYAGFDGEHPAVARSRDVAAATAACLLVRQADFQQLGGFDPLFHNGYEDIDLCLRLGLRGRLIRYCSRSVVYHLESVTRWPDGVPRGLEPSERLYEERWRSAVAPDDIEHYLKDGLLGFAYEADYPLTVSVSPELAVVRTNGEELAGLERLLALRSRQVMDLTRRQTRIELHQRLEQAANLSAASRSPVRAERVAVGREHRLGGLEPQHFVSVLIPVKNGERHLEELLPLILGQSIAARLEIVAIDSGSTDRTTDVLERFGATVLAIDPAEFDHGLTRNLAAEHARGDVLVFLSQRSRPVGHRWLAPLIAALDGDPLVAGACSRVAPRPEADVLTRRDVERDLSASPERQRKQITDWSGYSNLPPEELRVFLNFHTVSAAIRTEAWRQHPFRSVRALGEDLLWAREALESGWALVHEPASVVHHSHEYALPELFSRNVDDGMANRDIVNRSLHGEQLVPMIRAMIKDDWSYLRETIRLGGEELERWEVESALRRVAQAVGQWMGINYETLPSGTAAYFSSVARARAGTQHERAEK